LPPVAGPLGEIYNRRSAAHQNKQRNGEGEMAIRSDSAGLEKQYLLDMLPAQCKRILEIGCGDGRLTWQYAALADSVVAIDVTPDTLAEALRERPERFCETTSVLEASGVCLPFKSDSFDQALFSLSL